MSQTLVSIDPVDLVRGPIKVGSTATPTRKTLVAALNELVSYVCVLHG